MIEIGGAPGFRGRDRLAQRGDDFGRAQRELGELVLAQRRRELRRSGIEVNHAAGPVEQASEIQFAAGESYPPCIVTEGRGTIQVSYKGKSYWVCCSGCKDLFNDNPEAILAEGLR